MLVRRSMWAELGGFDPGLPSTDAGLDFSIRTRLAGARVVRVPAPGSPVPHRSRTSAAGVRRPIVCATASRGRAAASPPDLRTRRRSRLPLAQPGAAGVPPFARPPAGQAPATHRRRTGERVHRRVRWIGRRVARSPAQSRRIPWTAIAPLRVPADELRERRAADRERRSGTADEPELVRASFFGGGGAWIVLFAAVAGVAVFWSLLQAQVIRGGALLPIGSDIARLWTNLVVGPREGAVDLIGPADPFSAVVAALGSLTAWNPSFSLVLLWLTALPLAALGAWWCATRMSERRWPPLVAALLWMLAPPLLSALTDGRPTGVLVHLLLPWLVLAGIESRRSWSAAATASLLFAVVVACSPIMAPVLAVLLVVWAAVNPRGIVRIVGIAIPAAALFAPLAFWQITHGTPLALLADPGPAVAHTPPSGWLLLLGHPSLTDDRWADVGARSACRSRPSRRRCCSPPSPSSRCSRCSCPERAAPSRHSPSRWAAWRRPCRLAPRRSRCQAPTRSRPWSGRRSQPLLARTGRRSRRRHRCGRAGGCADRADHGHAATVAVIRCSPCRCSAPARSGAESARLLPALVEAQAEAEPASARCCSPRSPTAPCGRRSPETAARPSMRPRPW